MAKQRGGVLIRLWGQSRDGTGGANCLSTVGPCCFLPLPLESTVLCFSVMAQPLMWGGLLPVCVCGCGFMHLSRGGSDCASPPLKCLLPCGGAEEALREIGPSPHPLPFWDDRGNRAPAAAALSPAQLLAVAACTAKAWPSPGPRGPLNRQPRSRSAPEPRARDARARPDKGAAPARPSPACRPPRTPARPNRSRWAPRAGPARGAGAAAAEHGEIQQQVEA